VKKNKAIFFDRDGVINKNIFYSDFNEFESPRIVNDIKIYSDTLKLMHYLQTLGYFLFIVSNQPSFAKGKISFSELQTVTKTIESCLKKNSIKITFCYYCYHHPKGIISNFKKHCKCRKPSPFFLKQAEKDYMIDLKSSWMIGDRDTDIECGLSAGCRTIQIKSDHPSKKAGFSNPHFKVNNIKKIREIFNDKSSL